jgi:F-type H+-transporting ATPase subunit b
MMCRRIVSGLVVVAAMLAKAPGATAAAGLPPSGPGHPPPLAAIVPSGPPKEAAHSGAAEGGEEVNPLSWKEIKGDLAIWTAAVFLVLLLVLWRFAWGPLAQGLDKREAEVANQIAQAEQANRQAQELLSQYEQKLADARSDVRGILDQARRDAEQLGHEMLDKAKAEARAEQQRALRQIDAATVAALEDLADRGATLAVDLAGKILRAQLSPQDHAQLIQQTVADFVGQPPSKS